MVQKLSPLDRATLRSWCLSYAIDANKQQNIFCGTVSNASSEKIVTDARKFWDFVSEGAEDCEILTLATKEDLKLVDSTLNLKGLKR